MKYVVIGGAVLWIVFCIARALMVASHRADEQMEKIMIGGNEHGVNERS